MKRKNDYEVFDNFPTYAIVYAMYGDASGLEEEDVQAVDKFMLDNGLGWMADCSEDSHFSNFPAFGKACEVTTATFRKK